MKTIFIINPRAGQGKKFETLIDSINAAASKLQAEMQVYITKAIGDAQRFVKEYCETFGAARFIACGGDGTFNEVLNGAIEFDGIEVGVVPIGTGNDFCKNFKNDCNFEDILLQMTGKTVKCDAIKYSTLVDGVQKEGYCANMFNIGFDCNVVDMTESVKKKKFLSGSFAYIFSVFVTLIKKKGAALKIELDGITRHNGELLLTSVANGSYCGGGFKSNPLAATNDGFININIVKNVSRLKFVTLLPDYKKGTFLNRSGIDKIVSSEKCRRVTITPCSGKIRLCTDGEVADAGKTEFEIKHNAFNFVIPSTRNTSELCERAEQMV